jgi:hypothetical protein
LFLNFEQNWSYKPEGMEKIEKKFNLEIWIEILKKLAIPPEGIEKNWNEETIYFIYATEIKLPIIPYTTFVYHHIPQVQVVVVYINIYHRIFS